MIIYPDWTAYLISSSILQTTRCENWSPWRMSFNCWSDDRYWCINSQEQTLEHPPSGRAQDGGVQWGWDDSCIPMLWGRQGTFDGQPSHKSNETQRDQIFFSFLLINSIAWYKDTFMLLGQHIPRQMVTMVTQAKKKDFLLYFFPVYQASWRERWH